MNDFNNKENAKKFHKQEEIKAAKADADRLEGKTFKLTAKAGANGKLFGSVNAKDVAAEIKKSLELKLINAKSLWMISSNSALPLQRLRFIRG